KALQKAIADYKDILGSTKRVQAIIVAELEELKKTFGDDRRTQVTTEAAELTLEDLIPLEEVVVTLSHGGYVKRLPVDTYRAQNRGGKGITGAEVKDEDFIENLFVTS